MNHGRPRLRARPHRTSPGAVAPGPHTGDTAWTSTLIDAAADADLLIAEAYYQDKNIPHHLRHADLDAHRDQLTARHIIITHMSADMLSHQHEASFQPAHDGLTITV